MGVEFDTSDEERYNNNVWTEHKYARSISEEKEMNELQPNENFLDMQKSDEGTVEKQEPEIPPRRKAKTKNNNKIDENKKNVTKEERF
ncbi:hypothetical protein ACTXT7_005685 [Hymenolepis weldensis]